MLSFVRLRFLQQLFFLLNVTTLLHSIASFAGPIDPQSLSPRTDSRSPKFEKPVPPALQARNINLALMPSLAPRGQIAHYRQIGAFNMFLTAYKGLWSATDQIVTPGQNLLKLLGYVANEATTNIASNAPGTNYAEWGYGSLSLAIRLRDGLGGEAAIPWTLISQLTDVFQDWVERGNPSAFRAVVNGPLPKNWQGVTPWIEVVLVVAGEKVMDGFPWSIN